MPKTPPRREDYNTAGTSWYVPHIGIPCTVGKRTSGHVLYGNNQTYARSVALAGGIPVLLPPLTDKVALGTLGERLDGLLLPGGADLHPHRYGEQPHPCLGAIDPVADQFELALARECLQSDRPTLGINRGAQLLNVVAGGSLYQDVRSQRQGCWQHATARQPRDYLAHPVTIASGTRLATVLGTEPLLVNSFHHQAVKTPGRTVVITASAPDGIVEALEFPNHCFAVGVQWAAEELAIAGDRRMLRLFQGFIGAARTYGAERQRARITAPRVVQRLEVMWERDLATYERQRQALFAEPCLLGTLGESQARRQLPMLKGRIQAIAEALGRPAPMPSGDRL